MMQLFQEVSRQCSRLTTEAYSTSFSKSVKLLHRSMRTPIYNIYGFVRFADEIVDTFHAYDKRALLDEFEEETFRAIERGISLNPVLQSFQETVNAYHIDLQLIKAFFRSMRSDLYKTHYDVKGYQDYIYGSAEVVGLMCLHVFCDNDKALYASLKEPARALGAAFQKVNFLRDAGTDYHELKRTYFPGTDFSQFTSNIKSQIEADIENDFRNAYPGIIQLPAKARLGVYVAYKYYWSLFRKIRKVQPERISFQRIRVPDYHKFLIILKAGLRSQLNLL